MKRTPTDWQIVTAMCSYGDSFVRTLAIACAAADPEHFDRIKKAFPELWDEYADIVELRTQRERIVWDGMRTGKSCL
jgi:hypothetical protein